MKKKKRQRKKKKYTYIERDKKDSEDWRNKDIEK